MLTSEVANLQLRPSRRWMPFRKRHSEGLAGHYRDIQILLLQGLRRAVKFKVLATARNDFTCLRSKSHAPSSSTLDAADPQRQSEPRGRQGMDRDEGC